MVEKALRNTELTNYLIPASPAPIVFDGEWLSENIDIAKACIDDWAHLSLTIAVRSLDEWRIDEFYEHD